MTYQFKSFINTFKFARSLKNSSKDQNGLTELIELAKKERGILYKIIQHIYPDQLTDNVVIKQALEKDQIKKLIEKYLNITFDDHFSHLSEPVFCASIGQLHKAILKTNSNKLIEVAIKVQYPHVKQSIQAQLKLLKLAAFSSKFSPIAKWNMSLSDHILQIEERLYEELNYRNELKNLIKYRENNYPTKTSGTHNLYEYCSEQILTQAWIEGINIHEVTSSWNDAKKKIAAEQILSQYFKQVFKDGFFQGDTNISNFIFQESGTTDQGLTIEWIDFGNWVTLPKKTSDALLGIIAQSIKKEEINYLGYFENIGFDIKKLKYFENSLPLLTNILFEPFLTNIPYDLSYWKLEERINGLLGENKWWFRSSGNSELLELMRSFYGIIGLIKKLMVNINWQQTFLLTCESVNTDAISRTLPVYENSIPNMSQLAKNMVITITKNGKEHVKIELPATSFLDLENFIPEDVKEKLEEKGFDLKKIKFNYLEKGLVPGDVFSFENMSTNDGTQLAEVKTKYEISLF